LSPGERAPAAPGSARLVRTDPETICQTLTAQLEDVEFDALSTLRSNVVAEAFPPATGRVGPALVPTERLPLVSSSESEEADLTVVRQLGEGGMGRVDLAVQRALRREVAVKTALVDSTDAALSLVQEAMFGGFLEHPNIVPIHLLGRDQADQPLLVMKRVEGVAWRDLIREPDHPHWQVLDKDPLQQHLEILMAVCNAVHFAHSNDIVHRDIKPENVMIGGFGEVYLLDWGVATRVSRQRSEGIFGTLAYMAPEMLDGEATPQSDVYLLGASLHEVLTGRPPHPKGTVMQMVLAIAHAKRVEFPLDVPSELGDLCNQAMDPYPEERPESALELRQRIEQFLEHRTSVELCGQAQSRLEELKGELSAESSEELAASFAACRFGFEQALRVWPENAPAAAGLQTCLELSIDRELRRRNRGIVQELLAGLPRPVPELQRRLKRLEQELEAEKRSGEALATLHKDLDPRVAGRQRARLGSAVGILTFLVACGTAELSRRGLVPITHEATLVVIALFTGALAVGGLLGGREVISTTFGRRLAGCVLTGTAAAALNHVMCWLLGLPALTGFAFDALILVVVTTLIACTLDRRTSIVTVPAAAPAIAAAAAPAYALEILGAGVMICSLLMGWIEGLDH
jgi:hypothetical protein